RITRHYMETTWEMRVDEAETAAAAVALLRREATAGDPIRVAIFDAMPDAKPAAFARMVRSDPSIAGTSLIQLIALNDEPDEVTMREAGINAYTSKPAGQRELFDALTVALAHDAIPLARSAMAPTVSS